MDIELKEMKGPITASMNATNSKAELDLQMEEEAVKLNKNLTSEIVVTPELSSTLLKDG